MSRLPARRLFSTPECAAHFFSETRKGGLKQCISSLRQQHLNERRAFLRRLGAAAVPAAEHGRRDRCETRGRTEATVPGQEASVSEQEVAAPQGMAGFGFAFP